MVRAMEKMENRLETLERNYQEMKSTQKKNIAAKMAMRNEQLHSRGRSRTSQQPHTRTITLSSQSLTDSRRSQGSSLSAQLTLHNSHRAFHRTSLSRRKSRTPPPQQMRTSNSPVVYRGNSAYSNVHGHRRSDEQMRVPVYSGRKVDLPLFNGEGANNWIIQIERYFRLNDIEEEEKVEVSRVAMKDRALTWFHSWEYKTEETNWDTLKKSIIRRFQPELISSHSSKSRTSSSTSSSQPSKTLSREASRSQMSSQTVSALSRTIASSSQASTVLQESVREQQPSFDGRSASFVRENAEKDTKGGDESEKKASDAAEPKGESHAIFSGGPSSDCTFSERNRRKYMSDATISKNEATETQGLGLYPEARAIGSRIGDRKEENFQDLGLWRLENLKSHGRAVVHHFCWLLKFYKTNPAITKIDLKPMDEDIEKIGEGNILNKYAEHETCLCSGDKVVEVLEIPNQQLGRYFENCKVLVDRRPLSECQCDEKKESAAVYAVSETTIDARKAAEIARGMKRGGMKIENQGCFVPIDNGGQGLGPRSEFGVDPSSAINSRYHVEQVVKCREVSSIPTARRVNCSTRPIRLSEQKELTMTISFSDEGNDCMQADHFCKLYMEDMLSCSIVMRTAAVLTVEGVEWYLEFLQENQLWDSYIEDRNSCSILKRTPAGIGDLLACLLKPFMPSFSHEIGQEWKEEEAERYKEKFASSTETCVVIECLKVTEENEPSLDTSYAGEMSVISNDLVFKFLVPQSVKYWEGRGARIKWKWKIMADSYY